VPIFAVALIKSGPEPLTEYTASAAIRKCLGKKTLARGSLRTT
jgi:hypothetical protein